MNNSDITGLVAEKHSVAKADAKAMVDTVFAALAEAASRDEEVSIASFGKFRVSVAGHGRPRLPRSGRDQ